MTAPSTATFFKYCTMEMCSSEVPGGAAVTVCSHSVYKTSNNSHQALHSEGACRCFTQGGMGPYCQ